VSSELTYAVDGSEFQLPSNFSITAVSFVLCGFLKGQTAHLDKHDMTVSNLKG
jgi:hypothetical protein